MVSCFGFVSCQDVDEDLQSLIFGEWDGTSFLSSYSTVSQIKCNFAKDGRFHDTYDTATMSGSYTVNGSKVHIKCYSSNTAHIMSVMRLL